jgi:two-component sensor histidine kinase
MLQRNSALDGKWRSYAFAKIDGFPVFIGRGISQETIEARWRRNLISYLAFFASSVAVLLALGYFAWRQHSLLLATNANLEALVRERTQHLNRALAEKTAYFREVHHRVKNNLQIISSLVRLQQRHGEDSETLERRIQAMALVHELLYSRAEATDLDVADYVVKLCAALEAASGYRDTCHVTAEPAPIDLERAIPFALILSEAVSNAYKHARPEGDRLRIDVGFRLEGGSYVLTVSDNGAETAPSKSGTRGFGNKLVAALSQQLGGDVSFGSGAGAPFTLRFPAERPPRAPQGILA